MTRRDDIDHAIEFYIIEVDYLLKLPDYSEEDKARMLARAQRLAEPHPTHSISPEMEGAWTCACGAEGFDVFDLASHFNEAAHPAMRDDPVAIINAQHGLKTVDYDADYLWTCDCGAAGEDLIFDKSAQVTQSMDFLRGDAWDVVGFVGGEVIEYRAVFADGGIADI